MAVGAAAVLNAASAMAGPATSTTTTSTTAASSSTSTTTTTLLGGCAVEATFDSILCRLDALIAEAQTASDLGRLKGGIVGSAQKAKKQCAKAAMLGTGKSASNQVKKCSKSLDTFRHKLDSNNAHKIVPEATRNLFRDQAAQLRTDANSLRGTL